MRTLPKLERGYLTLLRFAFACLHTEATAAAAAANGPHWHAQNQGFGFPVGLVVSKEDVHEANDRRLPDSASLRLARVGVPVPRRHTVSDGRLVMVSIR